MQADIGSFSGAFVKTPAFEIKIGKFWMLKIAKYLGLYYYKKNMKQNLSIDSASTLSNDKVIIWIILNNKIHNYFNLLSTRKQTVVANFWANYVPSYGDCVGPRIMTLKYRILSSDGDALIPGAATTMKIKFNT